MSVPKKESKIYTYKDILNLPEGERAELIDGKLYMMASPSINHQRIVTEITYSLLQHIKRKGGKCSVMQSPSGVRLFNEDKNYVEPDLYVACDRSKFSKNTYNGAPDMVVEVLSPSSTSRDMVLKYNLYMESGVQEYWVVDIDSKRVNVFNFAKSTLAGYSFNDEIPVGVFNGDCRVCLKDVDLIEEV